MSYIAKRGHYVPALFNLADDFFRTPANIWEQRSKIAPCNIVENEANYEIKLVAPGFSKENFNLSVDKNMLSIKGIIENKQEDSNEKFTRREFVVQSFERSFTLPEIVDGDAIGATYDNGILSIVLPKKEEAKAKEPRAIVVA